MALWKKTPPAKVPPSMPDLELEGERVILRPPKPEDYQSWIDVRGCNRKYLKPFEPTWPENCLSHDFYERRLRRQAYDWHRDLGRYFIILRKDDQAIIGGMNINYILRGVAQSASLGYWIDEAEQGKGYMAEAIALTLHYGFTNMDLNRINAATILNNERSQKLLERAGFVKEGVAKSYLKIDGRFQDHILYAVCKEDWMEQKMRTRRSAD